MSKHVRFSFFLLIALATGVYLGRVTLPKPIQTAGEKVSKPSSINHEDRRSGKGLSENDKIALLRWLGRPELFRMANRFKSADQFDYDTFKETIDFELVDCISDSFELNDILTRLDLTPSAEQVAVDAMTSLSCKNEREFRMKAESLGFCHPLYVQFYDSTSQEYASFSRFLEGVFAKIKKLDGRRQGESKGEGPQ